MSAFKFSPLDKGLWVQCQCGAEMLYPPDTLRLGRPVYCPCGALDFVSKDAINQLQSAMFRSAMEGEQ